VNHPAFVGRDAELALLTDALAAARDGTPRVIFLEGAAGIGKSALLQHFATTVRGRKTRVAHVEASAAGAYDPVHEAALAATGKRIFERFGGKRRAVESGRSLVSGWIGVIPGVGNILSAIASTADVLERRRRKRDRLQLIGDEDIAELVSVARRRPLLLLLDDGHLATPQGVSRLESLVRFSEPPGTRLLLVVAYRPNALGSKESPIQQLLRIRLKDRVEQRTLGALTREEVLEWRRVVGLADDPAALAALLTRGGGHAGLTRQLLEETVSGHQPLAAASGEEATAPSVEAAVTALPQIEGLPALAAEAVRLASAIGEEFDSSRLAQLAGIDELMIEDRLAMAVHLRLLTVTGEVTLPDGDIATRYRFREPHVRAAFFNSLAPAQRKIAEPAQVLAPPPI
jgi:hypothetical protein